MLLDTDAVIEAEGHYRATSPLADVAVPETLHALIAARLDANLPEDRARLQDASVVGQSFTVEAVAAIAGVDPASLGEQLDRLVRRQLLVREGDPRSPERGQYRFVRLHARTAGPGTSPLPVTSRRSTRTSWRASSPATTSPPSRLRAPAPRQTPWPRRLASPFRRPPIAPPRSNRTARRSPSSSRLWR
jgi:hypothetical protein